MRFFFLFHLDFLSFFFLFWGPQLCEYYPQEVHVASDERSVPARGRFRQELQVRMGEWNAKGMNDETKRMGVVDAFRKGKLDRFA